MLKPVTSLFTEAAKSLTNAQKVLGQRTTALFAAGAVGAPALMSNEDRGYGQTALITTPALASVFVATPEVKGVFARTEQTGSALWRYKDQINKIVKTGDIYGFDKLLAKIPKEYWQELQPVRAEIEADFYNRGLRPIEKLAAERTERIMAQAADLRGHFARLADTLGPEDAQWKSVAGAVREAAFSSQSQDHIVQDLLRSTKSLPEGAAARNFVQTVSGQLLNGQNGFNQSFVEKMAQRRQQNTQIRVLNSDAADQHNLWRKLGPDEYPALAPKEALQILGEREPAKFVSGRSRILKNYLGTREEHQRLVQLLQERGEYFKSAGYKKWRLQVDEANNPLKLFLEHENPDLGIQIGLTDHKTGRILGGGVKGMPGVSSSLIHVDAAGQLQYYRPEEFLAAFHGKMSGADLWKNVHAASAYQPGFNESRVSTAVHLGDREAAIYAQTATYIDAPVHFANRDADSVKGLSPQGFSHEQRVKLDVQRLNNGELPYGGTGAFGKDRRIRNKPKFNYDFWLDRPMGTDVTEVKPLQFAGPIPERHAAPFWTRKLTDTSLKTGDFLFGVNLTGASPTSMDYFGKMANYAFAHAGLPETEKGWWARFKESNAAKTLEITGDSLKENGSNPAVRLAYKNFKQDSVRSAFHETAVSEDLLPTLRTLKADASELFFNSVPAGIVKSTEDADRFFGEMVNYMAERPSRLRVANQIGIGGGEAEVLVNPKAMRDMPTVFHRATPHKVSELSEGLLNFVATENGQLKANWRDQLIPHSFALGLSPNDHSIVRPKVSGQHVVLSVSPRDKEGFYEVTTALAQDVTDGTKWAFGNKKVSVVKASRWDDTMEMLKKFYNAVGDNPNKIAADAEAIANSAHHILDVKLGPSEELAQVGRLLQEAERMQDEHVQAARQKLEQFLGDQYAVKHTNGVMLGDEDRLAKLAREAFPNAANEAEAHMSYAQQLQPKLFGTQAVTERAELMALKGDFGLVGELESAMMRTGKSTKFLKNFFEIVDYKRPTDYLFKSNLRVTAGVMGALQYQRQRAVRPTEDAYRQGAVKGQYAMNRDLMGRAKATSKGDPRYTARALDWLEGGSFGEVSTGVKVVKNSDPFAVLKSEEAAGTVLDWRNPELQQPFYFEFQKPVTVDIKGVKHDFAGVMHTGYGGFGGAPDRYRGEFGMAASWKHNPYGQAWQDLVRAEAEVINGSAGGEKLAATLQTFLDSHATLVTGKKRMPRVPMIDPNGFGATPQKATTLSGHDFDVFLNPKDWHRHVKRLPADVQKLAKDGKYFYARHSRHPILDVNYVRVRPQRDYLSGTVGISDLLRLRTRADFDWDPSEFNPVTTSNTWREAHSQLTDLTSRQWEEARVGRLFRNIEENRNLTNTWIANNIDKDLSKRLLNKYDYTTQLSAFQARSSGRYVGHFSHLTTRLQLGLESYPGLEMHPELSSWFRSNAITREGIFDIRQSMINMMKKLGTESSNPERFLGEFMEAWGQGGEEGANKFVDLFARVAAVNDERVRWTPEHEKTFGHVLKGNKEGDSVALMRELITKDKQGVQQSIKDLVLKGRSEAESVGDALEARAANNAAFRILTRKVNPKDGVLPKGIIWDVLGEYRRARRFLATQRGASGMATQSAAQLGALNAAKKIAAREGGRMAKPAWAVASAGLALAAGAGLVLAGKPSDMQPLAQSPPPPSARPEERLGLTDRVPGQPEAGSMSGNPEVQLRASGGVRRAVVAPMRRSHDLTVDLNTGDDSLAQKVRKNLSDGLRGDAFITQNNTGGWRDSAHRVRNREQIREDLGRF